MSGDGGGFFNANSAHPFENPTALTGMLEMLLIFLIGAPLTNTFGRMVGDQRQGWALYAAMAVMLAGGLALTIPPKPRRTRRSPTLVSTSGGRAAGRRQHGRQGGPLRPAQSALFATVTTASSDGAVNAMHDSFMPLSGLVLMSNMMLDEVIVGGPGSGLFGMLLFAIVAVFVAGLMIGRTPEYLGKKIEGNEVKMTMLALLCVPAFILGIAAVAAVLPGAIASLTNTGPHGFSELLYAYTLRRRDQRQRFRGPEREHAVLQPDAGGARCSSARFVVIVPVLCIAGTLAAKRVVPAGAGTLPTHGPQFVGLLVGTVVIVGGLTFFSALALGPIAEFLARG